jgi:heme-degrading monooxygenase HmoA
MTQRNAEPPISSRPRVSVNPAVYADGMEQRHVWMTTRRIKPGTLDRFRRAWRPEGSPEGLAAAFAYWSDDGGEVTGVSLWTSREACDEWRTSAAEERRRQAMAEFVEEETEAFYDGVELTPPA